MFAEEAFKTVAQHPSSDAALKEIVDEYTRLCPTQVAEFRTRARSRPVVAP
jgi:hypothetical protein